jgi:hypothetical protein
VWHGCQTGSRPFSGGGLSNRYDVSLSARPAVDLGLPAGVSKERRIVRWLPWEVKPEVTCGKILWHVKDILKSHRDE